MFLQDITRQTATALPRPLSHGLTGATPVETQSGWRAAHSLRIGDRVHTFDGGLRPIRALRRESLPMGSAAIHLPGGMLDACCDTWLLPGQFLLLDHPTLITALIPAEALTALPAVTRRTFTSRIDIITPVFAEPEAIWAASGLRLLCPGMAEDTAFQILTTPEARRLLSLPQPLAA